MHKKHPCRRKRRSPIVLASAIFLIVTGIVAFVIPLHLQGMEMQQEAREYGQLKQQAMQSALEASSAAPVLLPVEEARQQSILGASSDEPNTQPQGTGVDLAACLAINTDFIGWIQIPGTTVDYPVVQTDDADYYLNHTFTGKKSYIGTLFSLDNVDFQAPSRNIAIYGHHIRSNDEVMFSPLLAYKEQAFYIEHKTIYFDTLYHAGTYEIFAVVNIHQGEWNPSTSSFASEEAFVSFIRQAKAYALYDTGVEVQLSDHILTLITCDRSYGGKSGRLLVMGVKKQ